MKKFNVVKKYSSRVAVAAVGTLATVPAFAAYTDEITGAFTAATGDVTLAAKLLIGLVALVTGLGLTVSLLRR